MSYVVGVTGPMGCGKTSICSMFESLGATAVSLDSLMYSTRNLTDTKESLVELFGDSILSDNCIDIDKLISKAFGSVTSLYAFDSIIMPGADRDLRTRVEAFNRGAPSILVLDTALLYEHQWDQLCDFILSVECSTSNRAERLSLRMGIPDSEARSKMMVADLTNMFYLKHRDMEFTDKLKRSNGIIFNDSSWHELVVKAKFAWNGIVYSSLLGGIVDECCAEPG